MENADVLHQNLNIAEQILKTCYWGNVSMTPQYIIDNIDDVEFARGVFGVVLYNSPYICKHLQIFNPQHLQMFIKEYSARYKPSFKAEFLNRRLKALVNLYNVADLE